MGSIYDSCIIARLIVPEIGSRTLEQRGYKLSEAEPIQREYKALEDGFTEDTHTGIPCNEAHRSLYGHGRMSF